MAISCLLKTTRYSPPPEKYPKALFSGDKFNITLSLVSVTIKPKYPKKPKNFGERIRKKRMDVRLTMREIAERLGVSETTVYNWGIRNRKPYRRTEEKLRTILDLKEEIPIQRPVLYRL